MPIVQQINQTAEASGEFLVGHGDNFLFLVLWGRGEGSWSGSVQKQQQQNADKTEVTKLSFFFSDGEGS